MQPHLSTFFTLLIQLYQMVGFVLRHHKPREHGQYRVAVVDTLQNQGVVKKVRHPLHRDQRQQRKQDTHDGKRLKRARQNPTEDVDF